MQRKGSAPKQKVSEEIHIHKVYVKIKYPMYTCIIFMILCLNQVFQLPDPLPTIADFVGTQSFHSALSSPCLRLWNQETKGKPKKI